MTTMTKEERAAARTTKAAPKTTKKVPVRQPKVAAPKAATKKAAVKPHPLSDQDGRAKPNKAAAPKPAPKSETKAAAEKPAKPVKPAKTSRLESNSETVREIVRLASRKEGATSAELIEASGWKNAGWPWVFHNKQTGKGLASRYDMDFTIIERPSPDGKRPRKAYKLSKKAA